MEIGKTTVYLRKNASQVEQKNDDGSTITLWQYDEAQLTHKQYEEYQKALSYFGLFGIGDAIEAVEQEVTDAEITNVEQEQSITDNELAITELESKLNPTTEKEA